MCGIVGILTSESDIRQEEGFVRWALRSMKHRGPDSIGIWDDGRKYMTGFVRLAIRDTSSAANQPMVSPCGHYVLSFNGEIYNTDAFIPGLEARGVKLKTTSDTEVLLHSLIHFGHEAVLPKLDGIFGFGFYDIRAGRLLLARDRAGIKPLYFSRARNCLVFSSQYDHVINHPSAKEWSIDPEVLRTYLELGFVPSGRGIVQNTELLASGSYLLVDAPGEVKFGRYYDFPAMGNEASDQAQLGEILSKSVKEQLVSDVPIGTFLSGGVDSPLVSSYAKKNASRMHSYTIAVDDKVHDESDGAQFYSRAIGTEHHVKTITQQDLIHLTQQNTEAFSEPFADFSSLPTLMLSGFVRETITVALSGDGGDELFWGYPRNVLAYRHLDLITGPRLRTLAKIAREVVLRKPRTIPLRYARVANIVEYAYRSTRIPGAEEWVSLLCDAPSATSQSYCEPLARLIPEDPSPTVLMGFLRKVEFDLHLQRILLKVDRASMFKSLEVRVPFLSNAMLDFAAGSTPAACIQGKQGKVNLKTLLSQLTGSDRAFQAKRGFSIPIGDWLRGPLRADVEGKLHNLPSGLRELISGKAVERLVRSHMVEGDDSGWLVWCLYSLVNWHDFHRNSIGRELG